jgi:ABC-type nitrate/sulfonate/bicarbonate transport system permease component
MYRWRPVLRYVVALGMLCAGWALAGYGHALKWAFIPSIGEVVEVAARLQPSLLKQIAATTSLVAVGFLSGLIAAWAIAYLSLTSGRFEQWSRPVFDLLKGVPPVCFVPFFILWFGFEPTGKIILIVINVAMLVYPVIVSQFRALNRQYWEVWRGTGKSYDEFVRLEVVPATVEATLPTLRFSLSFAVMMALIAEVMGATVGLGHVMSVALNTFSLAAIIVAAGSAAGIAVVLDIVLVCVVKLYAPWLEGDGQIINMDR